MAPDPLPAGARMTPPRVPLTRIGAAGSDGGCVLIDVRSRDESGVVAEAFRRLGWRVEEGNLVAAVYVGGYDMVFTDQIEAFPLLVEELHPPVGSEGARIGGTQTVVLVDSDDEAVLDGWQSGADWVVARPFDPDDPLKWNNVFGEFGGLGEFE